MSEALRLTGLRKSFGRVEVLRGISLAAHDGDVIALIGASGSGKSTLLRCIPLLETPDAGEVAIAGEAIRMRATRRGAVAADPGQVNRLRAQLGFVFQGFNLWSHMTVLQNVLEAPLQVQRPPRPSARGGGGACWTRWASPTGATPIPPSSPAASSSASPSPARWPCARAPCCSTSRPRPSTPSWSARCCGVMRAWPRKAAPCSCVTHEMGFAREVSSRAIFLHQGVVEEDGPPEQVFSDPKSERCRRFVTSHLRRG